MYLRIVYHLFDIYKLARSEDAVEKQKKKKNRKKKGKDGSSGSLGADKDGHPQSQEKMSDLLVFVTNVTYYHVH